MSETAEALFVGTVLGLAILVALASAREHEQEWLVERALAAAVLLGLVVGFAVLG